MNAQGPIVSIPQPDGAPDGAPPDPDQLLDSLVVGVLITDAELKLSGANATAQSLLGTGLAQLLGQGLESVPALAERHATARRALSAGQPISERAVQVNDTPVDVHFTPLGENPPWLLIELVPLARQMELAEGQTRERQQQALAELLRGLGHEIKNPLGGLRGAAQLLEQRLDDADLTAYTQVIINEADRLATLVDRLQRQCPVQRQPLNLHRVLEHVAALVQAEHERVHIERLYDPSIPDLPGDRDRLVQMLLNLAGNAVEAGARRLEFRSRIRRNVTIGAASHRTVISLEVADDAGGVATELRELLFYPLITGRPDGTGLGLSLAQQIATEHGGIIRHHDREGGSEFHCLLPLVPA